MSRPWGIHTIHSMFADPRCVQAGLPDGRYVTAIIEPYPTTLRERIRAAWWVFTERAYAVQWPEAGDLEELWGGAQSNQYHSGMPPTMSPSRSAKP